MLDRTQFLVVGEALLGVDRANTRLNSAKQLLETSKAAVEAARADIETAKEGVATAKANLETILSGFENSGLTKSVILTTAEELNRVFGQLEPAVEPEVAAEPELSKSGARKIAESLRDVLGILADRDGMDEVRSALEDIISSVQSTGTASKEEAETKPRRKRKNKGEDEETGASASAVETAPADADPVAAIPATDAEATAAVEAEVEPVVEADLVEEPGIDLPSETALPDVVVETATVEVAAVVEEPKVADAEVSDIDNSEVRDEVLELIDSNVSDESMNTILVTTAYAVFMGFNDRALSLHEYIDAMTVSNLKDFSGTGKLDQEIETLTADLLDESSFVDLVLNWFRSGVSLLEQGKEFPAFGSFTQGSEGDDEAVSTPETSPADDVPETETEFVVDDAPSAEPIEAFDASDDDTTLVGHLDHPEEEDEARHIIESIDDVQLEEDAVAEEPAPVEPMEEEVQASEVAPEAAAEAPTPAAVARPAPAAPSSPQGLKPPTFFQRPKFPSSS